MHITLLICIVLCTFLIISCTNAGKATEPVTDQEKTASQNKITCYDSDGAIEFAVKGKIFGEQGSTTYEHWDSCLSKYTVKEWYCQRNIPKYISFNCQYQYGECKDGACIKTAVTPPPT